MYRKKILLLLFALVVGGSFSIFVAKTSANALSTDQIQRDLTRVLSEVFHRAHSQSVLGEVVRPKYGSPEVDLPDEAVQGDWAPTCDADISALASDPSEYPFALLVVPRDEIANSGASFIAFAIFSGSVPLAANFFENSPPDWLTAEAGGYPSLAEDFKRLITGSLISMDIHKCDEFSFAKLSGQPR
jgi:hypothetical protein